MDPQPRIPSLIRFAVERRVMDRIQATGQLLAQAEASVAAQAGGAVTSVARDEGARVERGEVIFEIDPKLRKLELESVRAKVVQARAQLKEAQREAERLERLAAQNAASVSQVDHAQTQLDMTRSGLAAAGAQLGLAERALANASVVAPFAGLIARRHVSAGEYVKTGEKLFDLVALDPVEVEFYLSEFDSARVAVGQIVTVKVAPYPGEVFEGVVSVVAPTIDSSTRTRRAKALLQNADGRLLPGTFSQVDLGIAEREGVIMVRKEAILQRADGSVIFRLVGADHVERVPVEVGTQHGELVEILGAVAEGDGIVVRGHTGLQDGSVVSLRDEEGRPVEAKVAGLIGDEG